MDSSDWRDISLTGGPHGIPPGVVRRVQRGRVLDATVAAVAERGFRGASVSCILERAHVSRRTFYELFADREDCFVQAYEEAAGRLVDAVAEGCRRAPAGGRAEGGLDAGLRLLAAEPDVARMCVVEVLAAGPVAAARRGRVMDELARLLARERPDGDVARARMLLGGVHELVHDALVRGEDLGGLALAIDPGWLGEAIATPGPAGSRSG